jgi:hypothetical protein
MLLGEEYWLIVRIIRDTLMTSVGKTQSVLMLQQMVNTVNTVLPVSNTFNISSYGLQNMGRPAFLTSSYITLTANFVEISPLV